MPTEKAKEFRHPSYGVIGISKAQAGGATLFDSPFVHQNIVKLRIHKAVKYRDLHQDWIHDDGVLIEVSMSEAQFATMITSPNQGSGTPCTLKYVNGKEIEAPGVDNVKKTYAEEIQKELGDVLKMAKELRKLSEIKDPKAAERNRIRELSLHLFNALDDGLSFFQRQFAEKMTDVVAAARAEVEAHVNSVIQRTGLEQLREGAPRLGGSEGETHG